MKTVHTLLASLILLACGHVQAQGRPLAYELSYAEQEAARSVMPLDAATRAKRMAELEAWLRRLVGRYRIDGSAILPRGAGSTPQSTKPKGVADCVFVGKGPGVQCIIYASWASLSMENGPSGSTVPPSPSMSNAFNTLKPMMMLFGLDHDSVGIQLYAVDETGTAYLGSLFYNRVGFLNDRGCVPTIEHCIQFLPETPCDGSITHCFPRISIVIKPGDKLVQIDLPIPGGIGVGVYLRLHRDSEAR